MLEDLPPELGLEIFSYLDPSTLTTLSHVSRLISDWASDTVLWRRILHKTFGPTSSSSSSSLSLSLSPPPSSSPPSTPSAHPKQVYGSLISLFAPLPPTEETRVLVASTRDILTRLSTAHPSGTVSPFGASPLELDEAEDAYGPIPPHLRAVYTWMDGEDTPHTWSLDNSLAGLFGSIVVYSRVVNMRLLPLSMWGAVGSSSQWILFGAAFPRVAPVANLRAYAYNKETGQFALISILRGNGALGDDAIDVHPLFPEGDSLLGWMENYASRLEDGEYGHLEEAPGVCGFPLAGVSVFSAISHGVECQAVPYYLGGTGPGAGAEYKWAYQVRLFLAEDEDLPVDSLVLVSREWTIVTADGDEETISGPGVIGLYPRLDAGVGPTRDEPFQYASQTFLPTPTGSMRGRLLFVDASYEASPHESPEFWITVPEFTLDVPPYAY